MRAAILRALKTSRGMTHTVLLVAARRRLPRGFKGSIPWYHETVKLDLEARGLIQRQTGTESSIPAHGITREAVPQEDPCPCSGKTEAISEEERGAEERAQEEPTVDRFNRSGGLVE